MKKVLILTFIMCGFAMNSSYAELDEKPRSPTASLLNASDLQNWYATTGVTRKSIGTNYSINIRVKGSQLFGGCVSISDVQISNGGRWLSVSYYNVIGEDCTYYVNVGGETYYFTI